MQLHISPSLRHVTVFPSKGFKEFIKVKVASKRVSYRMLFYSLLVFTFLLRFVFVLTAVDGIDGENKCTTIGTLLAPFSLSHALTYTHIRSQSYAGMDRKTQTGALVEVKQEGSIRLEFSIYQSILLFYKF